MTNRKFSGPAVTLAAAAALGLGLFAVNVAKEDTPAPPTPVAASAPSTPPQAPPPSPAPTAEAPAPQQFPATADYVADIPTNNGVLVLEITVDGTTARAYACDNVGIEEWLSGSAVDGVMSLTSADQGSLLDARLDGDTLAGSLSIDGKQWDFRAIPVEGDDDVR